MLGGAVERNRGLPQGSSHCFSASLCQTYPRCTENYGSLRRRYSSTRKRRITQVRPEMPKNAVGSVLQYAELWKIQLNPTKSFSREGGHLIGMRRKTVTLKKTATYVDRRLYYAHQMGLRPTAPSARRYRHPQREDQN